MVQLLRLRQCTGHPFMLERTIKESWTLEDVNELQQKLARLKGDTRPFYEQCKAVSIPFLVLKTYFESPDSLWDIQTDNHVVG